jgi:hypothetical protein
MDGQGGAAVALDAFCSGVDIVIPCSETGGDSPFDAGAGDCKEGREVLNVLGEVDAASAGAGGVEWLFDEAVDCGDNFLDRGNSFSLREWLMPLGVPDIITASSIWIAVGSMLGAISDDGRLASN